MKNILLMGAGGFASEVYWWCWKYGFVMPKAMFSESGDFRYNNLGLKNVTFLKGFRNYDFVLAVGDPVLKKKFCTMAEKYGLMSANGMIFQKDSHPYLQVGEGSLVCPGSYFVPSVWIGRHVIVNLNCSIGHDTTVGDFTTISPGANISGNVKIGKSVYIGTNACVREGVSIGDGAVVGMGAVVLKDVPPNETWVGNPARPIKK